MLLLPTHRTTANNHISPPSKTEMDRARFIQFIIVSLATLGTLYFANCEVFTDSEQSAIDETIEELMNCKQVPGRFLIPWQSDGKNVKNARRDGTVEIHYLL
jgi:hypothetical protein